MWSLHRCKFCFVYCMVWIVNDFTSYRNLSRWSTKQGSKNWSSPIRLDQVVSASTPTATSLIPDTYTRPWIGWTRMTRPIFWVNSVNSGKKTNQQIPCKRNPSQQESNFQRNQRFLCKRKPMKIWNKPVTLSKAFKKSLGWRITYLTLNPPLLECRIFIFGVVPGGKVADRGCMVVVGRSDSRRGCKSWSSWYVREEDSKAIEYRSIFVVCWGRR